MVSAFQKSVIDSRCRLYQLWRRKMPRARNIEGSRRAALWILRFFEMNDAGLSAEARVIISAFRAASTSVILHAVRRSPAAA